jgi:leader peptidase (prepilin peptidase)/N-methyltransferase
MLAALPDRLVILVPTILQAAFFFALGASVGSFVNVVAGRWPLGQDFVAPASRCTTCGRSLAWWENIPILSWIALRGRCRTCGVWIGSEHVWVEFGVGLLFAGTVVLLYGGLLSGEAELAWWGRHGAWGSSPMLLAVLVLWGCLAAASLIDAATGYIPIGITGLALTVALVAAVVQGVLTDPSAHAGWPSGTLPVAWQIMGLGGLLGAAVACALLWSGMLPRSFASIEPDRELLPAEARREVLRETPFILIPVAGACLALVLVRPEALPGPLAALGTASVGMLVGGGSIWLTRILGTLGFGREAMGLGDVHLMAAAGAVIGWRDALLAYLIAPFVALGWIAVSGALARMRGGATRELPYGPHLALAVAIAFLGRPWVVPLARGLFIPTPPGA